MSWPFETWLKVAVRRFGITPDAFWDMPVREWLSLMKDAQRPSFDRAHLGRLMSAYPDEGEGDDLGK